MQDKEQRHEYGIEQDHKVFRTVYLSVPFWAIFTDLGPCQLWDI